MLIRSGMTAGCRDTTPTYRHRRERCIPSKKQSYLLRQLIIPFTEFQEALQIRRNRQCYYAAGWRTAAGIPLQEHSSRGGALSLCKYIYVYSIYSIHIYLVISCKCGWKSFLTEVGFKSFEQSPSHAAKTLSETDATSKLHKFLPLSTCAPPDTMYVSQSYVRFTSFGKELPTTLKLQLLKTQHFRHNYLRVSL